MPAPETVPSPFASLLADARLNAKRVASLNLNDNQKREFALKEMKDNVWPFLVSLAEAVKEQDDENAASFDELFEQEGSVIQPELAAAVFGNLQIGRDLAAKVEALQLDDLKKRELGKLIEAYRKSAELVEMGVSEAAVPLEAGDGEGPEDEDEEDDDGDDDTDGGEEAPVTAPGEGV